MTKICPNCDTVNSADTVQCACGHEWLDASTNQPESGIGDAETLLRRLVRAGINSLKFRLFSVLMIGLIVLVLACGVGFLEARDPIVRTLFGVGFLISFGVAAVGIVWLREKLT